MSGHPTDSYNTPFSFPSPTLSPKVLTQESNDRYQVVCEGKLKKFICLFPTCEKTFRFKSEIERHLSAHSETRPHTCKYPGCKKSFKRVDALDDHIRSQHTGEAPLVCPYPDCGERFSTTAKLRYHTALHEDQKPYKCNVEGCDRGFVTLSQLRQHEKSNLAHRKLGLTPDRKRSNISYNTQSPAATFYPSETEEAGADLSDVKKRVKYDAVNPQDFESAYYGDHNLPQHIVHEDYIPNVAHANHVGLHSNNNIQLGYESIKLNHAEPVVEKQEFLTNVLDENEVLKKRLNYTETMIQTMKGQLDKVMLLLPNKFDHMGLLGYKQAPAANHLNLAGLPDNLLPEIDNFFL